MNFDKKDFRHCMGRFATGITVVTTTCEEGLPLGMTINSFTSLSLEPPLILFNIDKNATNHDNFTSVSKFTVNILAEGQVDVSKAFASPSSINWEDIDYISGENNCPKIGDCIGYVECDTENIYKGGDHSIIIGRVTNIDIESTEEPLVYFKGNYRKIGEVI